MNDVSNNYATYCLHIKITKKITLKIGKLATFQFPEGVYLYCGSARKNFDSRVSRHISKSKKLHWHIDYLLSSKFAKIINVEKYPASVETECSLIHKYINTGIAIPFANGFGASDCKNRCPSHLLKML